MAKRYHDHVPQRLILGEFDCARFAYDNGVPTWRPDYVTEDGRSIVGSMVEGTPLSIYASRRPWRMQALMADLGRIHAEMHRLKPAPKARSWRVKVQMPLVPGSIPGLSQRQLRRANDILDEAASEIAFCHGDLAPANVRVREGRPAVFDWGRAGVGVRAVDVANAYSFVFNMPSRIGSVPRCVRLAFRMRAADAYISAYAQTSGLPRLPIEIWALSKLASEAKRETRALQRDLAAGAFLRIRQRVSAQL